MVDASEKKKTKEKTKTKKTKLEKLQKLQNGAARLVARPRATRRQVVHVSHILQQLHWLPTRQRICVVVFNCLHGDAPFYLMELLHVITRESRL